MADQQPAKEYIRLGGRVIAIENQTAAPATPAGLTASVGNAAVTLSWTASAGATSYNVYRSTTSGAEGDPAIWSGAATTYPNTGLTNGTTYFYKVKAVNASGTSGPSNEASATPQGDVPLAPTNLTATPADGLVNLSWTASQNATSYKVYRSLTSGGEGTTPIATGITTAAYPDTGRTNGTTYYYTVAAVNASGGTSVPSTEASATPQGPPAAPTGLTATAGNAQVSLTWNPSAGANSYSIFRGTAPGGETPLVSGVLATGYTDPNLTNGTTYYYKVAAVNSIGPSVQSNEASATPQGVPAAPTGLTATPGNAVVNLNWTVSAGASSYNVYRGTSAGGENPTPVATGITTAAYPNTGLTNGTTYYYKVKAVNGAGGTSGYSNEASATPQANAPVITNMSATHASPGSNVGITGTGFGYDTGQHTLTFNGAVASPWQWGPTGAQTIIPTDANTGNVVVTVNGVASNGWQFTVTPTITSISPTSGPIGTPVTIAGAAFGATQGSSTVKFGGVPAAVTSWSATSVVATVPPSAPSGLVVVNVAGWDSSGSPYFTVSGIPMNLVLENLTLSSGVTLYQAHNSITGQNNFIVSGSAAVTFQAGTTVRLEPGFHATAGTAGTTFHAFIDPTIQ